MSEDRRYAKNLTLENFLTWSNIISLATVIALLITLCYTKKAVLHSEENLSQAKDMLEETKIQGALNDRPVFALVPSAYSIFEEETNSSNNEPMRREANKFGAVIISEDPALASAMNDGKRRDLHGDLYAILCPFFKHRILFKNISENVAVNVRVMLSADVSKIDESFSQVLGSCHIPKDNHEGIFGFHFKESEINMLIPIQNPGEDLSVILPQGYSKILASYVRYWLSEKEESEEYGPWKGLPPTSEEWQEYKKGSYNSIGYEIINIPKLNVVIYFSDILCAGYFQKFEVEWQILKKKETTVSLFPKGENFFYSPIATIQSYSESPIKIEKE